MERSGKISLALLTAWLAVIVTGFVFGTRQSRAQSGCALCPFCESFTQLGYPTQDAQGQDIVFYGGHTLQGTKDNWTPSASNGELPPDCEGAYLYMATCSNESEACSVIADPQVFLQLWQFTDVTWTCDISNPTPPWIREATAGVNQTVYGGAFQSVCSYDYE